eukprot:3952267-Amphidinium_carterae.2
MSAKCSDSIYAAPTAFTLQYSVGASVVAFVGHLFVGIFRPLMALKLHSNCASDPHGRPAE